jgi:hypothetical protein
MRALLLRRQARRLRYGISTPRLAQTVWLVDWLTGDARSPLRHGWSCGLGPSKNLPLGLAAINKSYRNYSGSSTVRCLRRQRKLTYDFVGPISIRDHLSSYVFRMPSTMENPSTLMLDI